VTAELFDGDTAMQLDAGFGAETEGSSAQSEVPSVVLFR
jgi:hypothetical protein